MARNMEGKYTKLRWSYIVGYVDSYDVVHSRIFSYLREDGFDSMKMHHDLFGMVLKGWRWNFDKGVEATLGDRLEQEDWDRVREHLTNEYDIPFWSNGFHDIQFFIKKMDEEEL
jgi:hypothetical protein